jgi:hypothetical protein
MKKTEKERQPRDRVLAIKVTAGEKKELSDFAERESVNVSAWARKLLFGALRKNA